MRTSGAKARQEKSACFVMDNLIGSAALRLARAGAWAWTSGEGCHEDSPTLLYTVMCLDGSVVFRFPLSPRKFPPIPTMVLSCIKPIERSEPATWKAYDTNSDR